jgi:hypothetical protein
VFISCETVKTAAYGGQVLSSMVDDQRTAAFSQADVKSAAIMGVQAALHQSAILKIADERAYGITAYTLPIANFRRVQFVPVTHPFSKKQMLCSPT